MEMVLSNKFMTHELAQHTNTNNLTKNNLTHKQFNETNNLTATFLVYRAGQR